MYKKIFFTLILCCLTVSCGKKGDPVYMDSKNKTTNMFSVFSKKA